MVIRRLSLWLTDFLMYGLLIAVSAFMILPFIWMISTSLKPADEIFTIPPIIISPHSSLKAYVYLQEQYNILGIVKNTFVIAFGATILRLFFCALGGYGFAKFKFPGQGALFAFLLGTMVIPSAVTLVPVYIIMRDLKWIDTFWPLIIPGAANAFGIFFMRQYIMSVSNELMDAARIDGAGEFTIFWRIILPIIAPGLTSLGLIFFMGSWNDFLGPLIYLKSPENFTLPLIIRSLIGPVGRTVYDVQMAASVISLIPLLIIFLIFQRRFVEGITAGAIKG
ncbi:MAG TPA: carbohydrate ABC transporter permease [Anaerolineales bacterium]|nr:carbohydrate ABC transporter permease [Anaerolineales bacterium]HLO27783.1 carbohydrate ABC transporter permease [Anaerolineales bacterium]